MITEVTYYQFCKIITEDYNIELYQKYKTYQNNFPLKNGKRKINSFYDAIIVDKNGDEFPYMLTQTIRNEDKLINFDFIYVLRPKNLQQILEEIGLRINSKPCKICEGGGWYSQGTKYFYKNISCEI